MSMSASTIIVARLSKDVSGFQPSISSALVASPTRRSTSAGRKKVSSTTTCSSQLRPA